MFIDYYAILEISEYATLEEIKAAFRKQAIKWHPDRNPGRNTTKEMQRINEAYLILKDDEARKKFDTEYQHFKEEKKKREQETAIQKHYQEYKSGSEKFYKEYYHKAEYEHYTFNDEILKKWMFNAQKQSVSLAEHTIKDLKGMVKVGAVAGITAFGEFFLASMIFSIIGLIFMALSKGCH